MNRRPTVRVGAFWKNSKGRYYLKLKAGDREWTEQTNITTRNKRSKTKADKLAERRKSELLSELNRTGWSWDDFDERYRAKHLKFTSTDNQYKWAAVCRFVRKAAEQDPRLIDALMLDDIRPLFLTDVEALIRTELAAGSVPSYMGTLRSGLSWAASEEMMNPLPRRRKPPGRQEEDLPAYSLDPISEESLRKMQDVSGAVAGARYSESISRYLRALWLSGCRMREPLNIHASKQDCHRPIELDGAEPHFFWTAEQKNRRAGRHRITCDFAADVRSNLDRGGFFYRPHCETGEITDRTALSNLVSTICKTAEIQVKPGKFATAKYFRTSFCQRWSARGMPLKLIQEICRHASEATTRKYYVGDADQPITFDESRFGDQIGDH